MDLLAAKILVVMTELAQPGVAELSRVELPSPVEPAVVEERTGFRPAEDLVALGGRVRWDGWSRQETPVEALGRWVTIATQAAHVALHPPARWPGSKRELWRVLVTVARHESAFWRPVHEGRLRGSAGEVCLLQIHPVVWASLGVSGDDLVGVDPESTRRCLYAGAELMSRARRLCPQDFPGGMFATYGSGEHCGEGARESWVASRVATYWRTEPRDAREGLLWVAMREWAHPEESDLVSDAELDILALLELE
jgi:hypothetical protein